MTPERELTFARWVADGLPWITVDVRTREFECHRCGVRIPINHTGPGAFSTFSIAFCEVHGACSADGPVQLDLASNG